MLSLTQRITNVFIHNTVANEDEKAVVSYGLEALIYKTLHFGVAILIGALFGRVLEIIVFHLFYQKLRTYAGGHHAKSNIVCFLNSCGIAVATLIFWDLCPVAYKTLCTIVFLAVSVPIIWFLAPVEATNKPLDEVEVIVYRRKARTFLLVETTIIIILYFVELGDVSLVGATALFTLGIMLVLGKFKMYSTLFQSTRDNVRIK